MFEKTRELLDRYEQAEININKSFSSQCYEDIEFINNCAFDFAKILYSEIPEIDKIAKMICVMNGNELIKVKVE